MSMRPTVGHHIDGGRVLALRSGLFNAVGNDFIAWTTR